MRRPGTTHSPKPEPRPSRRVIGKASHRNRSVKGCTEEDTSDDSSQRSGKHREGGKRPIGQAPTRRPAYESGNGRGRRQTRRQLRLSECRQQPGVPFPLPPIPGFMDPPPRGRPRRRLPTDPAGSGPGQPGGRGRAGSRRSRTPCRGRPAGPGPRGRPMSRSPAIIKRRQGVCRVEHRPGPGLGLGWATWWPVAGLASRRACDLGLCPTFGLGWVIRRL